jgi:hypothetical protein
MDFYRIKDWDKLFENHESRKIPNLTWFKHPNKLDGDGYTELVDHVHGENHYAAWCALLAIASKGSHPAGRCVTGRMPGEERATAGRSWNGVESDTPVCAECRGALLRSDTRAHDASSLARMARMSVETFEEVLPRLVEMEWVELCSHKNQQLTGATGVLAGEERATAGVLAGEERATAGKLPGAEQNRTELDQTEQNRTLNDPKVESDLKIGSTQSGGAKNLHSQKKPAHAAAHRLPDDFELTNQMKEFVRKEIPILDNEQTQRMFENFCDYWRAASGSKARKVDWQATWRGWVRRDADRPSANGTGPKGKRADVGVGRMSDRLIAIMEKKKLKQQEVLAAAAASRSATDDDLPALPPD